MGWESATESVLQGGSRSVVFVKEGQTHGRWQALKEQKQNLVVGCQRGKVRTQHTPSLSVFWLDEDKLLTTVHASTDFCIGIL